MRHSQYRYPIYSALGIVGGLLLYSCASPGTPSGGPRDEDPPLFVRADPPQGATGVDASRATLEFDELVNVRDAFSKVVISPTAAATPRVTSGGRKIYIDFPDTLAPNTTYTVEFGNSIEDNNEGNKLQGFAYTFSTGAEIDSLRISGIVLGAGNLEPQQSMLVGVYPASAPDSAFKTLRMERIAKTDDRGRFVLRGLKPIPYRLFALADVNNDYRWDNPDEDIAFYDTEIIPHSTQSEASDTIFNLKTGEVDSVVNRQRTRFLPNDILLNSFNINFRPQYLVSYERKDSNRMTFVFNAPAPEPPSFRLLAPAGYDNWYLMERSARNDSITLWITEPHILASDTLRLAATFCAVERDKSVQMRNDTLRFVSQPEKAKKKGKSKPKEKNVSDSIPQPDFLPVAITSSGKHHIVSPVYVESDTPVSRIAPESFHIEEMKDTVWTLRQSVTPQPADTLTLRRYKIEYPWEYGGKYRITADSMAVHDIYGRFNRPLTQSIDIKKADEYFDLKFRITPFTPDMKAFVELLNGSDAPVASATVSDGIVQFTNIPLGTYYARLIADNNGNGIHDTGDYDSRVQPEIVYYYPRKLKITKHWEVDQPWDLNATAVDLQKPDAIKKNKPERTKGQPAKSESETEEEDIFDPTRNPFDPNDSGQRTNTTGSY